MKEAQAQFTSDQQREKASELKGDVAEAVRDVFERAGAAAANLKDKVTRKG